MTAIPMPIMASSPLCSRYSQPPRHALTHYRHRRQRHFLRYRLRPSSSSSTRHHLVHLNTLQGLHSIITIVCGSCASCSSPRQCFEPPLNTFKKAHNDPSDRSVPS
ncbi:hypothetical protein BDQ12DRAFT_730117 [Crucibulum laeve]|uniref:Uncharacterized protein n=1 Tax=Crucibulum laeve TaxID=68775 RepID=A0A5C3LE83_9AGAR|nr:hypothetical protein BDQ12DRAFT_730117 [Crucibulum laeve]